MKNKGRMLMMAATTITIGHLIVGVAPNVYVAGFGAFFIGLAGALFGTSVGTLIQASADESMRGRVSSVFQITVQLYAAGLVMGGFFTAWIDPGPTLLMFGVLIGTMAIVIFAESPELRNAS
ncbi:MAG TPA: hypothetical protein EYQ61_11545 [Dehalococcoidia bacterium]|nr:hypothetical protein [Dehalococcoidia bacterium]HIK88406.1 hypothetical protein [Dehalococcoidia bacterium]